MNENRNRAQRAAGPWRRAIPLYAILALGVFAFPGGMVSWLDERMAGPWLDAPIAIAHGIDAASGAIGVKQAGETLRRAFAAWLGVEP